MSDDSGRFRRSDVDACTVCNEPKNPRCSCSIASTFWLGQSQTASAVRNNGGVVLTRKGAIQFSLSDNVAILLESYLVKQAAATFLYTGVDAGLLIWFAWTRSALRFLGASAVVAAAAADFLPGRWLPLRRSTRCPP